MGLNSVCRSKEVGGSWVRRIREFNTALLGNWCWRMLMERESLWLKVLSTRYGMEEGRLRGGGRDASLWWRDVHGLCREEWFRHNGSRVIGMGKILCFGRICGWMKSPFEIGFLDYLIYRCFRTCLCLICVS